jgi:hypothetical protein
MRPLIVLVIVTACWTSAAAPPVARPLATPSVGSVAPPEGLPGDPVRGATVVIDTGTALYVIKLSSDASPVRVPFGARSVTLAGLGAALDRAGVARAKLDHRTALPGVPVVAAATTSADRILRIADALERSGRCLIPVRATQATRGTPHVTAGGTRCLVHDPGDEDVVQLTVDLGAEQDWIGLSRVNEFQEISPRGGERDFEKIETTLKEHKASAFFVDRTDAELTADGPVPYSELVRSADLLRMVGFIDLRFVPVARAAAVPRL